MDVRAKFSAIKDPRGEHVTASFKSETCVYNGLVSYRFKEVTVDPEKADGLRKETGDKYWPSEEELEEYSRASTTNPHSKDHTRTHHMGSDSIGIE